MHMLRISTATTLPMFTCSRSCCVYAALERERERYRYRVAYIKARFRRYRHRRTPHFMLMFMKTVDEYIHEG